MGKPLRISGVAVKTGVSKNNIRYTPANLMATAHELSDKPLLKDHNATMDSIVGRTLKVDEKGSYYEDEKVHFAADVMDEKMKELVQDGRAREVSIGAMCERLVVEEEGDEEQIAEGIHYMELSFTPTPGVDGAQVTKTALTDSNHTKTSETEETVKNLEDDTKLTEDFKMEEEEKKVADELAKEKETSETLRKELKALKEKRLSEIRKSVTEARAFCGLKTNEEVFSKLDESALNVLLNDAKALKEQQDAEAEKVEPEPEAPAEPEPAEEKEEEAPAEEKPAETPEEPKAEPTGEVVAAEEPAEEAKEKFIMFREHGGCSIGFYPKGFEVRNMVK